MVEKEKETSRQEKRKEGCTGGEAGATAECPDVL